MTTVTFKGTPVTLLGTSKKVGDKAPQYTVVGNDLSNVTQDKYAGKIKLISVVPSLDTGVCDAQTRKFNQEVAGLDNVVVLTISNDLPFAQRRWCGASGIDNVITLSDHRDTSFGQAYGVLMKENRLLARSVFVVDSTDTIQYIEVVPEGTTHPDYEKAIEAVKQAK